MSEFYGTDEEWIKHIAANKKLPQQCYELMQIVRKIPYYCGKENCDHFGCREIRDARDKCIEIFNYK